MDTYQYMKVFLDESYEHLQAISDNPLNLENQPKNLDIVHEIFRSPHTLKGMAATMNYSNVASLTHVMENVLVNIRNKKLDVQTEIIDVMFDGVEILESMIHSIAKGEDDDKDISHMIASW